MKKLLTILLGISLGLTGFTINPPAVLAAPHFQVDSGGTLTASLVSYYPMEGSSNDFYGTTNGTDTSISYSVGNGKVNQGAGYGGTSSQNYGNNFNISSTAFSVAGWVKIANASSYRFIFGKSASDGNPDWALRTEPTSGFIDFLIFGPASSNNVITGSTNVADGNWHFIVAERDGSSLLLYVDNLLDASTADSHLNASNSHNATMGVDDGGLFRFPNGSAMDEWGFWTKGLNSTERTDLYNGGSGQTMVNSAPTVVPTPDMIFY